MATEKWIAGSGVGLTWTTVFGTATLASLASGNAIQSDAVTNGTALDIFADVSLVLASAAFVSPNTVGVYLYPLNEDGTHYGDNKFASAAAGPPASTYFVGNIVIPAVTGAAYGTLTGIIMPPGSFTFVVYNNSGVAFAGSGNDLKYRTYNRSVA